MLSSSILSSFLLLALYIDDMDSDQQFPGCFVFAPPLVMPCFDVLREMGIDPFLSEEAEV